MRAEDFLALLRRQPFIPLRIHLSNGSRYEIRHPEMASLTRHGLMVLLGSSYDEGIPDAWAYCSWLHVTHVEDIVRPHALSRVGRRRRAS